MKKILALIAVSLLFFACDVEEKELPAADNIIDDPVEILEPWFRPAAKGANTALFFNITTTLDSALILKGAESNLAKLTEVHETYQREGDLMGMRHVDSLIIKPSSTFKFKPGAHHIMLINLIDDLEIGDSAAVTLKFKNYEDIKIKAEVKDLTPNTQE